MALSKLAVVNAALMLNGAKKITSLTDNTKSARLANTMYEVARNEMFDLPIDFKFATTRTELSALSTAPACGYDYQYELPSGCRRVLALVDEDGDKVEYKHRVELLVETSGSQEIERDVLLTDQSEVFIKYIRLRENVAKWPAWFARLVILNLAIYLCEPLKQDKQKKNQLLMMYEDARLKAEEANGLSDADVSDDNVALDKGNQDVIKAASDEETEEKYIIQRD